MACDIGVPPNLPLRREWTPNRVGANPARPETLPGPARLRRRPRRRPDARRLERGGARGPRPVLLDPAAVDDPERAGARALAVLPAAGGGGLAVGGGFGPAAHGLQAV